MEKKVTIAPEQVILLETGVVVKARDLQENDSLLTYNGEVFVSCSVKKIKKVTENLSEFMSGQGSTLECASTTKFLEKVQYNSKVWKSRYITMAKYLPLFGSITLTDHNLKGLASSLLYQQEKRPNKYTRQHLPLYLSKLSKSSLKQLLSYFMQYKDIKHLTNQSKNILIILLGKLGINFSGRNSHIATSRSGTITFARQTSSSLETTKRETIKEQSTRTGEALQFYFDEDVDNILAGSFICQTM